MHKTLLISALLAGAASVIAQPRYDFSRIQMEKLGRGLIAMRQSPDSVALSWRYLRQDPEDIVFNVSIDGKAIAQKIPDTYLYTVVEDDSRPHIVTVTAESKTGTIAKHLKKATYVLPAKAPIGYLDIPLSRPEDGWTDYYTSYSYTPGDCSMGDVDGDGEMEVIVKWDPSNAHDNSQWGYTGNVLIDCYKLSATAPKNLMWRIDLGPNIRAGAHYTQFMVYDLDGDGKAEMVCKTADGTTDGAGNVIGNPEADWCNPSGYILDGPEYLTVFSGETGAALTSTDYVPARGDVSAWGDSYGNRVDRYLACVAYLDGVHPSVVMCRGYYTRTVLAAWDWNGHQLSQRWVFDTDEERWNAYAGQGNHNLRVADVDGDGCDEIIYGSMAVDHNGLGLHNQKTGHGDAMHLTSFIPGDPGLQVWDCHENRRDGSTLRDANTGKTLFQIPSKDDVGRCMAADIDPTNPGVEMWSSASKGIRNYKGDIICAKPSQLSTNSAVWWDGDLLRELLDKETVTKWNWKRCINEPLTRFLDVEHINGTKGCPCLQADIVGDWREEVLLPTNDHEHLRLFMTPYTSRYRFWSFLQDIPYRLSVVTENVAYNQPTQPGFYFGPDLKKGVKVMGTVIK